MFLKIKQEEIMDDQTLYKNCYKITEMLLKNAAHSFGIDFACLNESMIELKKRIKKEEE
jgi:hypothetical protein